MASKEAADDHLGGLTGWTVLYRRYRTRRAGQLLQP